jgi:hypothetical protein
MLWILRADCGIRRRRLLVCGRAKRLDDRLTETQLSYADGHLMQALVS